MEGYSKYKIVVCKGSNHKRYMKRIQPDGTVTYHVFRVKKHRWQTKYGPYHTVLQYGGSVTFYNVGQAVEIVPERELGIDIDPKSVALGFQFAS